MARFQSTKRSAETTVEVRATGRVRDALGTPKLSFTFEGDTLRAFVEAFFEEYDVRDLVIAETEAESATAGGRRSTPTTSPDVSEKIPTASERGRTRESSSTDSSTRTSTVSTRH